MLRLRSRSATHVWHVQTSHEQKVHKLEEVDNGIYTILGTWEPV